METILHTFNEFNYMPCINFDLPIDQEYQVFTTENYINLFPNLDRINVLSEDISSISKSRDHNLSQHDIYEKKVLEYVDSYITIHDHINKYQLPQHVYPYTFGNLTKHMLEKGVFFKPNKTDYENSKKHIESIDKKVVTINGRNNYHHKDYGRNNNLKSLIEYLIDNNIYVIDCTYPTSQFEFNSDSYMKLSDFRYSNSISYFVSSNFLISVANAGGITNHMCTKANVIQYGHGGWVDNVQFGYKGESIFSASKKIKPTFKSNNNKEILDLINSHSKPVLEEFDFFDESKIVRL